MEENIGDVILLFDNYSSDSENLYNSFRSAGCSYPAAVIDDDGFLPEGILSVYGSFLGDFEGKPEVPGQPRYFNEIQVPDYWEITGTNSGGKIQDMYRERGNIFYAQPTHKRLVRIVDWKDEKGIVRSSDHYNRFGALYARTTFNKDGKKVNKSYFDASGCEIIVENYITGDIILNEDSCVHIFPGKTEFVVYFMQKMGYDKRRVYFNSLSTPFFVSNRLSGQRKDDILFWQEPISKEIPGNMQMILKGEAARTTRIYVQKKLSYERLLELGASPEMVQRKGFVYPFVRENTHRPETLICTNSDRVEHLQQIVEALPEVQFHVAALTEMSSKLMSIGSYENVHLYPGVRTSVLDDLFRECDFYLDINREAEIVSAVRRAFLNNQVLLGFQETLHNKEYVAPEHVYALKESEKLIDDLRKMVQNASLLEQHLEIQKTHALSEKPEAYVF